MSYALSHGVKLYYAEAGSGMPLIFAHEFAGDFRSWEPQMRFFSRHYRCIAFNACGWPPSEVPPSVEHYSQQYAADEIVNVLKLSLSKRPTSSGFRWAVTPLRRWAYAIRKPRSRSRLRAWVTARTVPLLVITGDEDTPCLGPALFIKQVCPTASVAVVPSTGHTINPEEPDAFNKLVVDFVSLVDSGRWRPRDPRSLGTSTLSNPSR